MSRRTDAEVTTDYLTLDSSPSTNGHPSVLLLDEAADRLRADHLQARGDVKRLAEMLRRSIVYHHRYPDEQGRKFAADVQALLREVGGSMSGMGVGGMEATIAAEHWPAFWRAVWMARAALGLSS